MLADFAVTQFFFEATTTFGSSRSCRPRRYKPVIPGIMPLTNLTQITRMAQLSGEEAPARVVDAVSELDDPAEVRRVGVEIAVGTVCGTSGGRCARVALLHDEPVDGDWLVPTPTSASGSP